MTKWASGTFFAKLLLNNFERFKKPVLKMRTSSLIARLKFSIYSPTIFHHI
ncbi:hypothetical protein PGB90_000075 [Kerria lacca]